jgi:hypothetical protein
VPECEVCEKPIIVGQSFVRVREDRTIADMVLQHDKCCTDATLKRRKMTDMRLIAIQAY